MEFNCPFQNCGRIFSTKKGLFYHQTKDLSHNLDKIYPNYSGNRRHQIFYESKNDDCSSQSNKKSRPASGVQCIDLDVMKDALIHTSDDEDYDNEQLDDNGDACNDTQNENNTVCWTEMCHNINKQAEASAEDILHPEHPDINEENLVSYLQYQHNLYSLIYGSKTIYAQDTHEFKSLLNVVSPKSLIILKSYLFAKSCKMIRNNGDELLKIIRFICPENERTNLDLPRSWKTVTRTIAEQTNFYNCHKKTIEFPSHWKMDKWNSKNGSIPENVVNRIRDIFELIADQFVNPVIQMLWKDFVKLECYKKVNDQGENVTCNIMTSEWAHTEQKEIEKDHPNGLLLPIIFILME